MSADAPETVEALPDGEALDVSDILAEAERFGPPDPALFEPLCVQEAVARQFGQRAVGPVSGRTVYSISDPFGQVLAWVRESTGREIGALPTWVRIWRPDTAKGALFVLHGARVGDEAELTAVIERGSLSRAALKAAAYWAFAIIGLNRAVIRIPNDREDVKALAQRSGFTFEGLARDGLGPGLDASIWAMRARTCPWLPHAPSPIPDRDRGPFHSLKVH